MYSLISKTKIISTFIRFNRLALEQKINTLESGALLIDTDEDKNRVVKLYFIDGFFVEKIVCKVTNSVIEIIPFKNGYRVRHFLRNIQYPQNNHTLMSETSAKRYSMWSILATVIPKLLKARV